MGVDSLEKSGHACVSDTAAIRTPARSVPIFLIFIACAALCSARESVYLKNGFCLQVDSHTQRDQTLVFRMGSGSLELPVSDVSRIQSIPEEPPAATPDTQQTTADLLSQAARTEGLPEALVRSVARMESGFRQEAVSRRGAVGLMQLMPGTAADLGVDPKLAAENAEGGAKYLRTLLLRYHGDSALALAAYNAGPGAVTRFGGVPPYEETRRYVIRVLKEYAREHRLQPKTAAEARLSTPSATN
jgi:hypothetical protein